jgi:hypothetical protein
MTLRFSHLPSIVTSALILSALISGDARERWCPCGQPVRLARQHIHQFRDGVELDRVRQSSAEWRGHGDHP